MKKLIILSAAVALILSSCGAGAKSIKTEQDSLAYAIGLDFGNYLKTIDSTINVDMVAVAMKDVLAGKPKMDKDSSYNFLREYFTVRKPAREKEASAKFLEEVTKNNSAAKTSASGLIYEVVAAGDTTMRPSATDKVRVIYEGKLKDGTIFDSSIQRGDTADLTLDRVIPGWAEGISYIGKGGKIKLWIPSDLAYGEQGAQPTIGPNQALMFEVELVDVTPVPAADATKK